jgi:3-dehydroquinate dehydratase-1
MGAWQIIMEILKKEEESNGRMKTSVVATVPDVNLLERLPSVSLEDYCDIFELRLDAYPARSETARASIETASVPAIITARHPSEGGHNALSTTERADLLLPLLDVAQIVDVEVASLSELVVVLEEARSQNTEILASSHDFDKTPSAEVLRSWIDAAVDGGADAAKLAVTLHSFEDLVRLVGVVRSEQRLPVSAMGMGSLGKLSRLVLATQGSILNYGYIDEPNAPGQWPARQLRTLIRDLGAPG